MWRRNDGEGGHVEYYHIVPIKGYKDAMESEAN